MTTRTYRIYGADGHRQRASFGSSFEGNTKDAHIALESFDRTGTHEYVVLKITAATAEICEKNLIGQIDDGIFENCHCGKIVPVTAYQAKKNAIREEACKFIDDSTVLSWQEIAERGDYFHKMGKRYGLLQEFRENGVC